MGGDRAVAGSAAVAHGYRARRSARSRGGLTTKIEQAVADKGCSSTKIRAYPHRRGIKAAIPERIDQINGRTRHGNSLCRLHRSGTT
ncbi:hypothetical protein [Streptomyces sp. SD31]|uniref:hypothetical protein n=1 Tax=Streptomyces sp. SD31 TaxID=3452208 RepID=UPI003F8B7601